MPTHQSYRRGNCLLEALPTHEWEALAPHFELVELTPGQMLSKSGELVRTVYFPVTAIISLLQTMENGSSVEIAAIGRDGTTGVPILTGGDTMPASVQAQCRGFAHRISAKALRDALQNCASLRSVMLLYMQALLTQVAQTAACNRLHRLDEQLSRWLLVDIDRSGTSDLHVTQQLIADMLGVRREGVTEASGKLRESNLIDHSRGRVRILDRTGLEARSCECYEIVKREFDRLLPCTNAMEVVR
ncbi:cAMP-binding domain of CRP or a regulatory subunit of cAMP-dependent protein kinases [Burkholderia sp. WP9]|uniref:Crp/Fnr family transcriptional regulator n=1 Tax=Burkholderia sp. WP9 TaxID=1500263 RepID=UPI000897F090|nr:Crp/Fnr family transcriptional regulator [Burkholderia sp. WP9]SED04346.1 cAMP-binding domain of CRP or a regulatory subunit of cAMP-dependent protein kinases [Burkholderia sp. WP9]